GAGSLNPVLAIPFWPSSSDPFSAIEREQELSLQLRRRSDYPCNRSRRALMSPAKVSAVPSGTTIVQLVPVVSMSRASPDRDATAMRLASLPGRPGYSTPRIPTPPESPQSYRVGLAAVIVAMGIDSPIR